MAECAECRLELDRLSQTSEEPGGESGPELLPAVFAAMLEWERLHDRGVLRQRLADGLLPYLGARATGKLIDSANGDGGELLATIEPVLAQFLGKQAAARLVSRVLDKALVRV